MKDKKPLYEKISICISIIVGICGILGISVFGNISLFKNTGSDAKNINYKSDDKRDNNDNAVEDNNIQEETYPTDSQKNNVPQCDDEDSSLSEEEFLIQQNLDLIQQLKAEYFDEDTVIFENKCVNLCFYEIGGYLYSNSMKSENYDILKGNGVVPTKVFIIDYFSDEIIYEFSPKQLNSIWYFPGNPNSFYCVAFHENYDIYVSPPIQVIGGDSYGKLDVYFNKEDYEYTPLFQLSAYLYDTKSDMTPLICSSDYEVLLYIRDRYSNATHEGFSTQVLELGILSFNNYSYFSLNIDYIMDLYLYHKSNKDLKLANNTFDGSVTNSNLVKIYFSINNEDNTDDQIEEYNKKTP